MTLDLRRAAVSGGEMAFADEGHGPPVVLLHGFPTSSHLWRDLVPMLAPRFRAIAPDLLGYGASGKPEDPSALAIEAQAGYVLELLDHLGVGPGVAAVGHDVGGGVAQLLALDGGASTVILVDSVALDSGPIEGVRVLQGADDDQVDEAFAAGVVDLSLDLGMSRQDRLAEEDREAYRRPWREDPLALVRAARGIDGIGLIGTEPRLRGFEGRALVVWGEDDPYLPAELAERLGELIPGATVAVLPGCSHYLTEDAPEAVLPLIAEYLRIHHLGESHSHEGGPVTVDLGVSFTRPERPDDPEA